MQEMRDKINKGFQKQPFMNTIGAKLGKISEGKCEIILPFNLKLTQQHGLFHGGAIATIADNAAGFAAYSLMSDEYQPLTIEFQLYLLSRATGKNLICRANVLKAGKTIFHVQSEVFSLVDSNEILTAVGIATIKASKSVTEITTA